VVLIIAYGNSLRRDDGAGLILGEMLEEAMRGRGLEVELHSLHQLTPDVALTVAADEVAVVIFVDTRVAVLEQGQPALQLIPLASGQGASSLGHQLGAATIMAYASLLYQKCPPAWLLTVPGVDFDHGEGLSEIARKALQTLPALLDELTPKWPLGNG